MRFRRSTKPPAHVNGENGNLEYCRPPGATARVSPLLLRPRDEDGGHHLRAEPPRAVSGCRDVSEFRGTDWDSPTDFEAYLSIDRLLGLDAARTEQICIYTGHFPYFARDLIDPSLFTITLLRDPVERTISVLKQFKRLEERCRDLTLDAIYEDEPLFRFYVENHQTKVFALTPHDEARTIMRPITIDDARFGWRSRTWPRLDVVGITESYDDFVEDLQRRLRWWPNGRPGRRPGEREHRGLDRRSRPAPAHRRRQPLRPRVVRVRGGAARGALVIERLRERGASSTERAKSTGRGQSRAGTVPGDADDLIDRVRRWRRRRADRTVHDRRAAVISSSAGAVLIATGIPAAIASATGRPKPSSSDGCTSSVGRRQQLLELGLRDDPRQLDAHVVLGARALAGASTAAPSTPASVSTAPLRGEVGGRRTPRTSRSRFLCGRVAADEHHPLGAARRRVAQRADPVGGVVVDRELRAPRCDRGRARDPPGGSASRTRESVTTSVEWRAIHAMYARISGASARDGG